MYNYVLKTTFRNRKNIYYILIFAILVLLFTITLNFYVSYKKMLDDSFKNDILYRNILLAPIDKYGNVIENINEIAKTDHVVSSHDMKYDSLDFFVDEYKKDNHEGIIEFAYADSVKSVVGRNVENDGELICSRNFYPSFTFSTTKKFYEDKEILDKEIIINEKVFRRDSGEYKETKLKYVKKFKVVGLFDPVKTGSTLNTCYASENDMKDIYDNLYSDLNPDTLTSYVLTIDDYKNINLVMTYLKSKGYIANTQVVNDFSLFNKIKMISCLLVIFIIVIYYILTKLYIKKNIIENYQKIKLLNCLGIVKKNIIKMETQQIIILSIVGYLVGCIIYLSTIFFIKKYFCNYLLFNSYVINFRVYLLLLSILFILIINLVTIKQLKNKKIWSIK